MMKRSVQLNVVVVGLLLLSVPALVFIFRSPVQQDQEADALSAASVAEWKTESVQPTIQSKARQSREHSNRSPDPIVAGKLETMTMAHRLGVESVQHLDRLGMLSHLTPEQEARFRAYFRSREEAAIRSLEEALRRGLMEDDETAFRHSDELEEIVRKHDTGPAFEDLLRSTLTADQYAEQAALEKQEREAAAVKLAREQLEIVVRHVDLSATERDHFYEEMCKRDLSARAGRIDLLEFMAGPGSLQMHKVKDLLDAGKAEILMKAMAAENQRDEEMLRELLPAGR